MHRPHVVVQWLKKLVHVLSAVGTQVRHQQVSIVERRQMIINVTYTDIKQISPTTTNITAYQSRQYIIAWWLNITAYQSRQYITA